MKAIRSQPVKKDKNRYDAALMTRLSTPLTFAAIFMLLAGCASSAYTQASSYTWRNECAGYYQLALPGEVDFGLNSFPVLLHPREYPGTYEYQDQKRPFITSFDYRNEPFVITRKSETKDFDLLEKSYDSRFDMLAKDYNKRNNKSIEIVKLRQSGMSAWFSTSDFYALISSNGFIHGYGRASSDYESGRELLTEFTTNFTPRQPFEMPDKRGVCIPYGFMADNSNYPRNFQITMRLQEHPEVEVVFTDKTADNIRDQDSVEEIKDLFNITLWSRLARVDLEWPRFKNIKLDGRSGKAVRATVTRRSGVTDYIYAADVKGDPEAKVDTPTLRLLVMRNTERFNGKPIEREEFFDIAEKIAASIKRRFPE